jgi:hypothetical protein
MSSGDILLIFTLTLSRELMNNNFEIIKLLLQKIQKKSIIQKKQLQCVAPARDAPF